jgi:hypothetical protein
LTHERFREKSRKLENEAASRREADDELVKHRGHLEQAVGERTKELESARRAALSLMQDAQMHQKRLEDSLSAQRSLAAQLGEANKDWNRSPTPSRTICALPCGISMDTWTC